MRDFLLQVEKRRRLEDGLSAWELLVPSWSDPGAIPVGDAVGEVGPCWSSIV